MHTKYSFVFVILTIAYLTAEGSNSCKDWVPFKDEKCIKIFTEVKSQSDADNFCKEAGQYVDGSEMASIGSQDEQQFVNNLLKNNRVVDNVWIGVKKLNKTFRQLDGSDIKYTNWANGRPLSDQIDSKCVGLSADEMSFGKWIDENCLKKNAILCQKLQTWSLSKLQNVLMDVRKNQADLIENPVPIGFIYVQLYGQPEPTQLWPKNKWQNVSAKYAGLFFRVEGGQARSFGQIQEQQNQHLEMRSNHSAIDMPFGPFEVTENYQDKYLITGGWTGENTGIMIKFKNSEICPRNQAIRVWVRIE